MAQSNVYSLNVVGYVNKTFKNGYYVLVSNPFNAATNDLASILPTPPDNTQIYRWNATAQDLDSTVPTYSSFQGKWVPNLVINPGEGFFVVGGSDFTNTFVGDVPQGNLTNSVSGNGNFSAIAAVVPVGGSITNVLGGYIPTDNDQIYLWDVNTQDFTSTVPTYSDFQKKWVPDVDMAVGDGFFLARAGAATTFVRNFTVQ